MYSGVYTVPPVIDSQGELTNPVDTTLAADTGALAPGIYDVLIVSSASANAQLFIQRRNVANDANVGDVSSFYTPAAQSNEFRCRYFVDKNERLRVIMDGGITGTAAVTIYAHRRA